MIERRKRFGDSQLSTLDDLAVGDENDQIAKSVTIFGARGCYSFNFCDITFGYVTSEPLGHGNE